MGKKLIIIIVAIAVAAGGIYFFVFRKSDTDKKQAVTYEYAIKDPFITNVKGSTKLFKTTLVLVVDDKKLADSLKNDTSKIRDTVLFVLRNLTEEDLKNQSIQDTLRKTLPEKLNKALDVSGIVSVRFTDFVMQ